ncbi:superoxide dismutase [Croceicoccus ponticola]|uniref:Superoxide dismutase n=1 Tax=Croceicoccus ponticola TaxID=2217664 RepID=A0A437GXI9_9SPHN|nr:superoxide dismutase [Croceicoccus ponticola]RVQ67089.1 superoxide dismutase [Croceicoccus ponticola]
MAIAFPDLPYPHDALSPAIGAETLHTHHGKHHKAYVDKTNAAIEGTDLADASLESIIAAADEKGDKGLFNNSAQSWNHAFYWHSMAPSNDGPSGELKTAIETAFGSVDALAEKLQSAGAGHFASGWVWLAADGDGKLSIEETHDAGTLAIGGKNPLLTLDVWEHAYYLDHKNVRPDYLKAVTTKHINWDFAAENYARGSIWSYPSA